MHITTGNCGSTLLGLPLMPTESEHSVKQFTKYLTPILTALFPFDR